MSDHIYNVSQCDSTGKLKGLIHGSKDTLITLCGYGCVSTGTTEFWILTHEPRTIDCPQCLKVLAG